MFKLLASLFVVMLLTCSVGMAQIVFPEPDPSETATERCLRLRDGDLLGISICYANDPEAYYYEWPLVAAALDVAQDGGMKDRLLNIYGISWNDLYYQKLFAMVVEGTKRYYADFHDALLNEQPELFVASMADLMQTYDRLLSLEVGVSLSAASQGNFTTISQRIGLQDEGKLGESLQCMVKAALANGGVLAMRGSDLIEGCRLDALPAPPWPWAKPDGRTDGVPA